MKKALIGLFLGLAILITAAFSTGIVQVTIFPGKLTVNEQPSSLGEDYRLFQYREHVYVPIRYVTEEMGGEVRYNQETQQIDIYSPFKHWTEDYFSDSRPTFKSEVNASDTDGQMKLTIYSEKKVYQEGEPIRIWASLENTGEEAVTLYSSEPVISFYMINAEQEVLGEVMHDLGQITPFNPNDEYLRQMAPFTISEFQYYKHGIERESYEEFMERYAAKAYELPKGTYTIGTSAEFRYQMDSDQRIRLQGQFEIEIQ
ncbi:stalk domain-containing protein [Marinicrinis lubricantis]